MEQSFRTTFPIPPVEPKIRYDSGLVFLGSCFAQGIGGELKRLKFSCDVNPTGILYNPLSIADCLELLLAKRELTRSDLRFHRGQWSSFLHHGDFSGPDPDAVLERINRRIRAGRENLLKADRLFLTPGTARVYYLRADQSGAEGRPEQDDDTRERIVANCHRFDASLFENRRLRVGDIVSGLGPTLRKLFELNPEIKVSFTLSPIRHWKDGAAENARSKAILLVAIHELIDSLKEPGENEGEGTGRLDYFPAYEILMDDLRDYRFYEEDLFHPSAPALAYIREKFYATYLDDSCLAPLEAVRKLNQAREHRARNPGSPQHLDFCARQLKEIQRLEQEYPLLDLSVERDFFTRARYLS